MEVAIDIVNGVLLYSMQSRDVIVVWYYMSLCCPVAEREGEIDRERERERDWDWLRERNIKT